MRTAASPGTCRRTVPFPDHFERIASRYDKRVAEAFSALLGDLLEDRPPPAGDP